MRKSSYIIATAAVLTTLGISAVCIDNNNKLDTKIKEQEIKIKKATETNDSLLKDVNNLKKDNSKLKQDLILKDNKINDLKKKIDSLGAGEDF